MEQTQRKQSRTLMTDELGNDWAVCIRSDGTLHAEPAAPDDYLGLIFTDFEDDWMTVPLAQLLGGQDRKA